MTFAIVVYSAKSRRNESCWTEKIFPICFIQPTAIHVIDVCGRIAAVCGMDIAVLTSSFSVISFRSRASSESQLCSTFVVYWTRNVFARCAASPTAIRDLADRNSASFRTTMDSERSAKAYTSESSNKLDEKGTFLSRSILTPKAQLNSCSANLVSSASSAQPA